MNSKQLLWSGLHAECAPGMRAQHDAQGKDVLAHLLEADGLAAILARHQPCFTNPPSTPKPPEVPLFRALSAIIGAMFATRSATITS